MWGCCQWNHQNFLINSIMCRWFGSQDATCFFLGKILPRLENGGVVARKEEGWTGLLENKVNTLDTKAEG